MKTLMLKILARFILVSDETLSIFERIKYVVLSIASFAPVAYGLNFFNLWFQDNVQFSFFVSLSLLLNAIVGAVTHIHAKTFCFKEFLLGNFMMAFIVICGALTLEMLRMTLGSNILGDGFRVLLQVTTLLYPCSKIMKNIFILSGGKFPPEYMMRKIYNFEKNGDLRVLFSQDSTPYEDDDSETGKFI